MSIDISKVKWYPSDICQGFDKFVAEATTHHNGKFLYFKQFYKNRSSKTVVQCTDCGGYSYPIGLDHLKAKSGAGCIHCFNRQRSEKVRLAKGGDWSTAFSQFPEDKKKNFSFFPETWVDSCTPFKVICNNCGSERWPLKQNFIRAKTGCKVCSDILSGVNRRESLENFISRCVTRHGDKYDYSQVDLSPKGLHSVITVGCKAVTKKGIPHKPFQVAAYDHLAGHGCPTCGRTLSEAELELASILREYGMKVESNNRIKLEGKELDLYLPDKQIAIEIDGLRWHSDLFKLLKTDMLRKTVKCEELGIRLIHVLGDEWASNKEKCISWVLAQCGIHHKVSNARETVVKQVSAVDAVKFAETRHMQGGGPSPSISYGLFDKQTGGMLAVMFFDSRNVNPGEIELTRFCSDGLVRGGFTKLLRAFINSNQDKYSSIVSFSDRRWSQGKIYQTSGFTLEGNSKPRYWWVKHQTRHHRRWGQRTNLEKVLPNFNESLSESENCRANGYSKLWDCGLSKWRLNLR